MAGGLVALEFDADHALEQRQRSVQPIGIGRTDHRVTAEGDLVSPGARVESTRAAVIARGDHPTSRCPVTRLSRQPLHELSHGQDRSTREYLKEKAYR